MSDPLSDVLSLLQVGSISCSRLERQGKWAHSFPAAPLLKFVAVMQGSCWISGAGEQPQRLTTGDGFLLINATGYFVSSDPGTEPADDAAPVGNAESRIFQQGEAETILFGGGFIVEGEDLSPLLDVLPSFLVIRADSPAAATLRTMLGMLNAELEDPSMGTTLMTKHLADMLLLQALRVHAANASPEPLCWIGALADKNIGAALTLMHANPGTRWTVANLAAAVGMSRSGFAARFKARVGMPPLVYLLQWRMRRARYTLRREAVPIGRLASELGYASESAFGNAFKRVFGQAPKQYWSAERR